MKILAIDGACRRNGKPDCTSAGGVFIYSHTSSERSCGTLFVSEYNSTNQRGELLALLEALTYLKPYTGTDDILIVTDSEYIYNAMTKGWLDKWAHSGFFTAGGTEVKNKDLWQEIYAAYQHIVDNGVEPMFYHIKGHCISFGRVTADRLLTEEPSGKKLLREVIDKFDSCKYSKADVFEAAQTLSEANNGFRLPDDTFRRFVVCNTMADAVATKAVDEADARRKG